MAITEAIDCCVYNASLKKKEQTKSVFQMFCWMICPSFKLLASSHEDIQRANQSKAEVVRTLDSSSVLQKGHNKLLLLPPPLPLLPIIIYKTPIRGHAWINLVHSARLARFLYRRRVDSLLHLTQCEVPSVIGIQAELHHFIPSTAERVARYAKTTGDNRGILYFYLLLFHEICNTCSTAICMSCLWVKQNQ